MSQSLYTAMSGISAATTDLEVISNNVANVNTTGFKSSSVNFSDVYYRTLSSGSIASGSSGGTNPVQVGVGTQVSSITRDFSAGSATATGVDTDLMIEGDSGFFTVRSTDGSVYYTRAGNFSWDDKGNLVTSEGYKVLGTDSTLSSLSSNSTVYVPTSLISVVQGSADLGLSDVGNLNGISDAITSGYFNVTEGATTAHVTLSTTDLSGTVNNMLTAINNDLTAGGITDVRASVTSTGKIQFTYSGTDSVTINTTTSTYTDTSGTTWSATNLLTEIDLDASKITGAAAATTSTTSSATTGGIFNLSYTNSAGTTVTTAIDASAVTSASDLATLINSNATCQADKVTATYNAGVLTISYSGVGRVNISDDTASSSTVLAGLGLNNSTFTRAAVSDSSKVLDYTALLTDVTSAAAATKVSSITINDDGTIEATYANGDTLSVSLDQATGNYHFVYTTTDESSQTVTIEGDSLSVTESVATPANFVIQLATITNKDGLISVGSNLYKAGANCGAISYETASELNGGIKSGYLEASNVDLSSQLSDMILAQRAIEANSRVFTTTSDVMSTIVQMGR